MSSSSTVRWDRSVWALMAVLCGVLFLDGLDVSMVGMALPSIESDLGLTTSQLQWIVSGYVLGYGGFLLLGGRGARLFGRPPGPPRGPPRFTPAPAGGGPRRRRPLLLPPPLPQGPAPALPPPRGPLVL